MHGTIEIKSKQVAVTFQSAAVATGNGTSLRLDGAGAILAQVTGITTATITWEATLDGTNWVAIRATNTASATAATTATADGLYLLNCSGTALVRARISAWTSGTITVTGSSTSMPFAGGLSSSGGSGTVTSVAQTVPAEFSVAGSPITTSGTLAISKATQTANTVWAGPTSGGVAVPAFRALVTADIPSGIALSKWTESDGTFGGNTFSKFIPVAAGSNSDAIIAPKGSGALLAQEPDGTTAGGNARGTYSVDFQMFRTAAAQVAAGTYSGILCGQENKVSSTASGSAVGGGFRNTVSGSATGIWNGTDNTIADGATAGSILSGSTNSLSAGAGGGVILSGSGNVVSATYGVLLGGSSSNVTAGSGLAWGTDADANHAGAVVFSSLLSGGAASAAVDECTLNFVGGYRFKGGNAVFDNAVTAGAGNFQTLAATFAPIGVSSGGTALQSATAYAVLVGGTTSTGAFQSIASVGSSGQVLTSNGASQKPTFQTAASGLTTGKALALMAGNAY